MAIAYVKDTGKARGSGVVTLNASFGTLPSAGNAVFGMSSHWVGLAPAGISTVTDNQSNTYTLDVNDTVNIAGNSWLTAAIASDTNIGSPSGTFTLTFTPNKTSGNYIVASGIEFSGIATSSAFDVSVTANSTTGDAATGNSASTAQADELVLAACYHSASDSNDNITTPTTGYTDIALEVDCSNYGGVTQSYKIVSSAGVQSATWTHDNTSQEGWIASLGTYKAAAGGNPTASVPSGNLILTPGTPKQTMLQIHKVPAHGT